MTGMAYVLVLVWTALGPNAVTVGSIYADKAVCEQDAVAQREGIRRRKQEEFMDARCETFEVKRRAGR